MSKLKVPDGWTLQAFRFALDCTPEQVGCIRRQFGGRRFARNWAVRTIKEDLDRYHATGEETDKPSLAVLRKRWNQIKSTECVDRDSDRVWWPEISKEAFSDGISGAVNGYWNWQKSRAGKRKGKRVGFPRFARKGRDRDRVTFTTGVMRVEDDRRHLTLPRIGTVRVHENTRDLQRLIAKGQARVLAVTVSRRGTRLIASLRVIANRPQQPTASTRNSSRVGVDVGVRVLATVADSDGDVLERVPNPKPLQAALSELRALSRKRSRRVRGSRGHREVSPKISRLHDRVRNIRSHHIHTLTARLAKTHSEIVIEGLDAAGMLRQRGLTGARSRRRGLSDSALSEHGRQLAYKTVWYGSSLIVADRFYPSSKTCHVCGHVQTIGWDEWWKCGSCSAEHNRDDNAAINLARYEVTGETPDSVVGSVGAAVKRGAECQTRTVRAAGDEARKGGKSTLAEQPRDGVPTSAHICSLER